MFTSLGEDLQALADAVDDAVGEGAPHQLLQLLAFLRNTHDCIVMGLRKPITIRLPEGDTRWPGRLQ